MAEPLLMFPNRMDDAGAALSGGSWLAALPLANLFERPLRVVARSADLNLASTQFLLTLFDPRRIRGLAFVNVNWDPTAEIRVLAGIDLRTNYLLYSEAIDNAAWTKTRLTVTANQALAGDGLQTLDRLIEDTSNNTHLLRQDVAVPLPSVTSYASFEAEANGRNIALYLLDAAGSTNYVRAYFNLGTGVVTSVANGGNGTGAAATIEALGSGNYRCTLSGKPNTSGTATRVEFRLLSGASTESYTGDGASGIYLGKVDIGTAPGWYVATTSAAAAGPDLRAYDSGWDPAYPIVYNADAVEWEDDAFFTGRPTAEDWENLIQQAVHIVGDPATGTGIYAKHWLVLIRDPSNPDGYVEIGRPFLGGHWTLDYLTPGALLGVSHPTITMPAVNGANSFGVIPSVRNIVFQIADLDKDIAYQRALDVMRRAGVHRELFLILDPEDTENLLRISWLCAQGPASEIGIGEVDFRTPQFRLQEIVA